MIIKLALRNIIGYGYRSLINIFIIAIVITAMIWTQAMYYSWIHVAETEARDWEIGKGMLFHHNYDKYDAFSWDKSSAVLPEFLDTEIRQQQAVPILIAPANIYHQGRMNAAIVKGIPHDQSLLKIPTSQLSPTVDGTISAVMGRSMAKTCGLTVGDVFTLRLKEASGSFNAVELKLTAIMNSPVPSVDAGKVWIDIAALQELRGLPNHVSMIVLDDAELLQKTSPEWVAMPTSVLLADLYKMLETEKGQQSIMFALLLFLGMIAIFDTQILALFKRRKEIGTLSALGMTKSSIIMLFTLEGILYMLFASLMTGSLGLPIFWYYARYGYKMPDGFEDMGMIGMSDAIRFQYPPHIIINTLVIVFAGTALVSWIPTLRIAKMNPTDALRGKVS